MTYPGQISRAELLVLVGHHAAVQGNWDSNNDPHAVICAADLDFVRRRVVKIRRMADGSVRVDLKMHGTPTI